MSDASDIIEYVEAATTSKPEFIPRRPGDLGTLVLDSSLRVIDIDLENLLPEPRRPRGFTTTLDAESFVVAVKQRQLVASPVLYADEEKLRLTAVLNDDFGIGDGDLDVPGWRDYGVNLAVRRTVEWAHWKDNQGLTTQEQFAATIEKGLREIQTPSPTVMLTIAETFEANIDARFEQGSNLQNGAKTLVYDEKIDAKAGKSGKHVEIPATFSLGVIPFLGGPAFAVEAALKFTVRGGALKIGYFLDRPHDVERLAFLGTVTKVAEELGLPVITGSVPSPRA